MLTDYLIVGYNIIELVLTDYKTSNILPKLENAHINVPFVCVEPSEK